MTDAAQDALFASASYAALTMASTFATAPGETTTEEAACANIESHVRNALACHRAQVLILRAGPADMPLFYHHSDALGFTPKDAVAASPCLKPLLLTMTDPDLMVPGDMEFAATHGSLCAPNASTSFHLRIERDWGRSSIQP